MGKRKRKGQKSTKKQYWGLPKDSRIEKGKTWVDTYDGDDIIKAYAKTFRVNLLNAMKELIQIGVPISSQEKARIKNIIKERKRLKELKKERRKKNAEIEEFDDSDETFAFIAGYTSGGAPYGITHEEMEEILKKEN